MPVRSVFLRGAGRTLAAALLAVLALAALGCRRPPAFRYDFEREADLDELGWTCRTLFRLTERFSTSGARGLEVRFFPDRAGNGENYPGLTLRRFDGDWEGRQMLAFEALNPEPLPLALTIRIDDREHPEYADRSNVRHVLAPGLNRVRIPLASLVTSGTRRPLDRDRIQAVYLFLANPAEPHVLLLDAFRLE